MFNVLFLVTVKLGLWLVGEDHRGKMTFSSRYMKGKNYLHDGDLEHLVAVVLVRFPHYDVTLSFPHCALQGTPYTPLTLKEWGVRFTFL